MEEQNVILQQNAKQAQELKEQLKRLEDQRTQLAEAKQTILQLSTVKAQKTILLDKADRLEMDSPLTASILLPFRTGILRCSDCFERLYVKEDCTYETPKITQF